MDEAPAEDRSSVVEAADRFERACRAGQRPRIETFLAGVEGTKRLSLLEELLRVERKVLQTEGTLPATEEYRRRFPDDAELVDAVFRAATETDGPKPGPDAEGIGSWIGPYKLLQRIGEGGMGVVYMADQEKPVRRTVALKLIKAGMDTGQVVARFEAERQALAVMDHPNIAKVFDAGATAAGRPFFVMELVKGVPITEYCDRNHLTARERLELFVPICQAIQHAHHKGIIHRDIKPSNVLIAMHDGAPAPMVIDFGVAKATDQRLTESTLFTLYGAVLGTPEYMSPEQAGTTALDIDTRSDVYSLGVLLYELLTGTTPLQRATLNLAAIDEVLRRIREEEPPRPSTRLGESGESLKSIAAHRKTESAVLMRLVRGELDWVVMKAIDKDRTRRYETANGLARDVQRYLQDEPVEACPPSAGYRLKKFARKNKGLLSTAAAFAALLVLWGVTSTLLMIQAARGKDAAQTARDAAVEERVRADREKGKAQTAQNKADEERVRAETAEQEARLERDRAVKAEAEASREARTTQEVIDFLQKDLLPKADGESLDRVSKSIAGKFADRPLLEASIRLTLGTIYRSQSQELKAQDHLERARKLVLDALDAGRPGATGVAIKLATAFADQEPRKAEPLLTRTLRVVERELGENHKETLKVKELLGSVYVDMKRLNDAERLLREVRGARRGLVPEPESHLLEKRNWAKLKYYQNELEVAEGLFEDILREVEDRNLGSDYWISLSAMGFLAKVYQDQNKLSQAEEMFNRLLKVRMMNPGATHPQTLSDRSDLAWVHHLQKSSREATQKEFQKLLEDEEAVLGKENGETLHTRDRYLLFSIGVEEPELAREISRRWPGPPNPDVARKLEGLGRTLLAKKQYEQAADVFRDCLTIREKALPGDWTRFNTESLLGCCVLGQKKYPDAERLLLSGYRGLKASEAKIPEASKATLTGAVKKIIELYDALDDADKAAEWRKKLPPPKAEAKPGP